MTSEEPIGFAALSRGQSYRLTAEILVTLQNFESRIVLQSFSIWAAWVFDLCISGESLFALLVQL